jgi:hypothetical protein
MITLEARQPQIKALNPRVEAEILADKPPNGQYSALCSSTASQGAKRREAVDTSLGSTESCRSSSKATSRRTCLSKSVEQKLPARGQPSGPPFA